MQEKDVIEGSELLKDLNSAIEETGIEVSYPLFFISLSSGPTPPLLAAIHPFFKAAPV